MFSGGTGRDEKNNNKKSSAPKGRLATCEQEIPNTSRAIGAAEIANN